MKIKKIYQGELPENTILNAESTSQTDTYSCEYINNLVNKEINYISVNKYQNDPLSLSQGFSKVSLLNTMSKGGNKLTLSNSNIVIGAGVSKIRTDGALALYNATGTFGVAIIKNNNTEAGRLTMAWGDGTANKDSYILTTTAYADVQEGDVISLYLYAGTSQTANVQNNCQLNVEVIG